MHTTHILGVNILPTIMITLSIIKAHFRPSFSPVIPPTNAPVIEPNTKTLARKEYHHIDEKLVLIIDNELSNAFIDKFRICLRD